MEESDEREERERGKQLALYRKERAEAYVFVERGDKQAFRNLRPDDAKEWRPRYVAELLTGRYAQLVFLEEDSLGDLRDSVRRVRNRVNPGTDTAYKTKAGPMAPTHWSPKPPIGGFIRIKVAPGKANQVLDALDDCPLYWGSATVAGTYHILLELGGDSIDEIERVVESVVRRTKHVRDADPYYSVYEEQYRMP
jgi:hypothetical protein